MSPPPLKRVKGALQLGGELSTAPARKARILPIQIRDQGSNLGNLKESSRKPNKLPALASPKEDTDDLLRTAKFLRIISQDLF